MNGDVRVGETGASLAPTIFREGWSGSSTGVRRAEKMPCEVRKGRLYFTANVQGLAGARMLYEVCCE
jgi:hypothetical protein